MTAEAPGASEPAGTLPAHPVERVLCRLEGASSLDGAAHVVDALASRCVGRGRRQSLFGGDWAGHALHPILTDFPLGAWMSATLVDLLGGPGSELAARRLVGFGLAAGVPTVLAGAVDWLEAGVPERRAGVVHAGINSAAWLLYAASLATRYPHRRPVAVALAVGGGILATAGGYVGGHLSLATDTGLRATAAGDRRLRARPHARA